MKHSQHSIDFVMYSALGAKHIIHGADKTAHAVALHSNFKCNTNAGINMLLLLPHSSVGATMGQAPVERLLHYSEWIVAYSESCQACIPYE